MALEVSGNRETTGGATYKRLETDNYSLVDFKASNFGGLISVQKRNGVVKNLKLQRGLIKNVDRVVTLPYDDAELDGALFEDLDCYDLERGFFRVKKARNVVIRRVVARQREAGSTQFCDAFATSDLPTENLHFEDVVAVGFDMIVPAGDYPNGGAFSDEELSLSTTYLRCLAIGGNDGWDLKGDDTITACVADSNNRNYRFWGSTTATDIVSKAPNNAHLWFGGGARLGVNRIVRPRFTDGASLKPHLKIDSNTSAAKITIIDPMDGEGNLIPKDKLRIQYDSAKNLTVEIVYSGLPAPVVDTTPRPPRLSVSEPVDEVVVPPKEPETPVVVDPNSAAIEELNAKLASAIAQLETVSNDLALAKNQAALSENELAQAQITLGSAVKRLADIAYKSRSAPGGSSDKTAQIAAINAMAVAPL